MNYQFQWERGAGLFALFILAILVGAWSRYCLRGKPPWLWWLRCLVLGLAGLAALKLSLEKLGESRVKPRLTVILDTGLTMGALDGTRRSRLQRSAQWLRAHRAELERRVEPVFFAGSQRFRRVSWEDLASLSPEPMGFDASQALRAAGDSARVWLFSDGHGEFGDPTEEGIPGRRAPVDAVGVGSARGVRALAIDEVRVPDFVFLHSDFSVAASVETADCAGCSVRVRLMQGSQAVAQTLLKVHGDYEVVRASFTVRARELGRQRYRLEASPADSQREKQEPSAGRAREFAVEVIRRKHRIMYLAGRPSFEYAQLRDHLKGNPNFELVSFVILRNPENISPVPDRELSLIPFPAQDIFLQSLFEFDVFILHNFAYRRFNLPVAYLENLKKFVARGGALLVIGGSNAFSQGGYRATPLEEVLPVELLNADNDYSAGLFVPRVASAEHPLLRLADSVEQARSLWEELPPLDGFSRFGGVRAGATVLLEHPSEKMPGGGAVPILATREYGKGNVMVLGTESTWRWKLGEGSRWKTASFYARFWERAVQYLSGTLDLKKVRFSPLAERLPPVEPATVQLRLFDEGFGPLAGARSELSVLWTAPDGRAQAIEPRETEPGLFEVTLTGLAPGPHRLKAAARYRGRAWGEDQIRFIWEGRPPETPLRRRQLQDVARRTGGRYSDLDRLPLSIWLEDGSGVSVQKDVLRRWHLWDSSLWLWAIGGLLLAEWIARRWKGYA
ncbi:MAG: hypothetical protein HY551_02050 [Elusimicrobia bacterium]|nr:hypothetical protein [Elusimicrobiota bacterium]